MEIVNIKLEKDALASQIKAKAAAAQAAVTVKAFADCCKYCKLDTGRLMRSGRFNILNGELSWNTPYASAAYYTGRADVSKNPNASLMWAHKASSIHRDEWKKLIERIML